MSCRQLPPFKGLVRNLKNRQTLNRLASVGWNRHSPAVEIKTIRSDERQILLARYLARLTRTNSLSLRANTLFIAKAGCDQIVMRRWTLRVGSTSFARLISS